MTVRKLVDYQAVHVDAHMSGEKSIAEYAADGYELIGGAFNAKSGRVAQTVVKYVDYHEDMKKKKRLGIF